MGIFSFFKKSKAQPAKLSPESDWIVEVNDTSVITKDYHQTEDSLALNQIESIWIETNDSGPWGTDIWWKIKGENKMLSVPGGASGESTMLEEFQKLPNFNNDEFMKSMSSVDNAVFLVWKK